MRFDYYAATIPVPLTHCLGVLSPAFGGQFLATKPVRPYSDGLECTVGGFRLYHGGENPHPYFVATGEEAVLGADVLRREFPSHRVARADVAYDFIEQGGFDRVVALVDPIARKAGVRVTFYGDPSPTQKAGRTMYFGSPDSDVRIRVYEKDLEQRGKGVAPDLAPEGWVRVELQTRPRKERKSAAATMTEAELFGLSKWSLKAAEMVLGVTVPYTPDTSMRETTAERAVRFMCQQYGAAMRAYVEQHGRKALDRQIGNALLADTALGRRH